MKITETKLKGCFIIEPEIYKDERGLFFESYNKKKFEDAIGLKIEFVQDNHSVSTQGTLRGLHFQKEPYAQSKLIRVLAGQILDVVVDLRKDSETYSQHLKLNLSASEHKMLFIPKGMAHGFLTLTNRAVFTYKCDNYYNKNAEHGITFNDLDLDIDWEYPQSKIILSDKDRQLPTFKQNDL